MSDNFYTTTILPDPRVNSATRIDALDLLEPTLRSAVASIIADAASHGIAFMVFETYRSPARQAALYAQGATRLRTVGVHRYGLACDVVKSVNGEPSWKGSFTLLGALAQQYGLLWGGDWGDPTRVHTFVDACHVQRCTLARQPELFAGTWYPDAAYRVDTDTES